MCPSMHPKRLCRSVPMRLLASVVMSGVLVTGCGGGSPGSTNGTVNGGTPPGSVRPVQGMREHRVECGPLRARSRTPSACVPTACPTSLTRVPAAASTSMGLRVRCPRRVQSSAGRSVGRSMGGGPLSAGPPASAQTMAQLRKIAVCMRAHGVPQFPDPLASVPHGFHPNPTEYREITNYQGAILLYPATIDPQSPAYEQATAACGAGFLAGNNAH